MGWWLRWFRIHGLGRRALGVAARRVRSAYFRWFSMEYFGNFPGRRRSTHSSTQPNTFPNTNQHTDADALPNPDPDADTHTYPHGDPNTHTDTNLRTFPNTIAGNCNENASAGTHRLAHENSLANSDSGYANPNQDPLANCHPSHQDTHHHPPSKCDAVTMVWLDYPQHES